MQSEIFSLQQREGTLPKTCEKCLEMMAKVNTYQAVTEYKNEDTQSQRILMKHRPMSSMVEIGTDIGILDNLDLLDEAAKLNASTAYNEDSGDREKFA